MEYPVSPVEMLKVTNSFYFIMSKTFHFGIGHYGSNSFENDLVYNLLSGIGRIKLYPVYSFINSISPSIMISVMKSTKSRDSKFSTIFLAAVFNVDTYWCQYIYIQIEQGNFYFLSQRPLTFHRKTVKKS